MDYLLLIDWNDVWSEFFWYICRIVLLLFFSVFILGFILLIGRFTKKKIGFAGCMFYYRVLIEPLFNIIQASMTGRSLSSVEKHNRKSFSEAMDKLKKDLEDFESKSLESQNKQEFSDNQDNHDRKDNQDNQDNQDYQDYQEIEE